MHLLLPLVAALSFALGSMVYKRAFMEGAGLMHAVVVNNVVLALLFGPLLLLEPRHSVPWDQWYQPFLTALTFVLGHLLNATALRVGDVSVATPLLGAKVIFVALMGRFLFGHHIHSAQWWSTGLATAGVILMGMTDFRRGGRLGVTTLMALGCAGSFAMTDLLIQAWGASFGVIRFISLQFVALGLLSLGLVPVFGLSTLRISTVAWKWMGLGIALSAVQAWIITGTIAHWKDATGVNVVYATRGIWSLALVWWVGRWMGNTERETVGTRRMVLRSLGGILILSAVALTA